MDFCFSHNGQITYAGIGNCYACDGGLNGCYGYFAFDGFKYFAKGNDDFIPQIGFEKRPLGFFHCMRRLMLCHFSDRGGDFDFISITLAYVQVSSECFAAWRKCLPVSRLISFYGWPELLVFLLTAKALIDLLVGL
ncbi:hypothetical protein [Snodgrassella gandavensis]|uniref:hypothetical protein n=1 Tax=Snodgrassella gandavensis TaxID=2946698 RepID=UPI001EF5B091|nr:hypothetical protein [Snodgrassella gandavensis]